MTWAVLIWTEALITPLWTKGHIFRCAQTISSESFCVSERGGGDGGEICPFSIRLLFPSLSQMVTAVAREILFCETPLNIYKSLCLGQPAERCHAGIWYTIDGLRVLTAALKQLTHINHRILSQHRLCEEKTRYNNISVDNNRCSLIVPASLASTLEAQRDFLGWKYKIPLI